MGRKFTILALFHFVFEGKIPSTSPPGGLSSEGRFKGEFFALRFWEAYTWRGLFSEFYGIGKTFFPGKSIARMIALSKTARFCFEPKIDTT